MILSTDFYWVSVPIPIANPKSTVHRLAHFTALVDFQLPRHANIERFSTHTHAHTHTRQCWQIKFHIRLLLLFSQPDFPLTWDFCAAIIKCFLISVYACAPLVCLLMSTASSPVSQPVSQSTSQSANHPVTQYPESLPPPPLCLLPLGYPSIQTGNQAVIHPTSSHKYLLCFQVATVENIRRKKRKIIIKIIKCYSYTTFELPFP